MISLREYDSEIEALIEDGQRVDEAMAHCDHILKSYPKHLETYRLLAKACLQARLFERAADVFRRLLAAVPDDFVSLVGMSVIAADNATLDDAIWHMERAFEAQPSNAAVQGELQHLLGLRDGVEPPKIRLTRAALAHVYMQGGLYSQAISEARAIVLSDPRRADVQSLLATAYFEDGQETAAIQACTELLDELPYCLQANRLLAEMIRRAGRAESVGIYRERLNELDPYAAFTQESVLDTAAVPDAAVTLERLEDLGLWELLGMAWRLDLPLGPAAPGSEESRPGRLSRAGINPVGAALASGSSVDIPPFLARGTWVKSGQETDETLGAVGDPLQSTSADVSGELPDWARTLASSNGDTAASDEAAAAGSGPGTIENSALGLTTDDASQSPAAQDLADGSLQPTPAVMEDAAVAAAAAEESVAASLENLPEAALEDHGQLPSQAPDSGSSYGSPPEDLALGATAGPAAGPGRWSGDEEPPNVEASTESGDERSAPDWLLAADRGSAAHPGLESEAASLDLDPLPADEWQLEAPDEIEQDFETTAPDPDWIEALIPEESVAPLPTNSQQEAPPWLRAKVEPSPGPVEPTRPADWQPVEDRERSGTTPTTVAPESTLRESNLQAPTSEEEAAGALRDAESALGRGSIRVALDMYRKLIRRGTSLEEIIRDLQDALYRYPVEVPLWQALGDAYMQANRLQEALNAYTKAEELLS